MAGIMADPLKAAEALTIAGVHAAGNANNVNYGAPAIRSSLVRLDELGILHIGGGVEQALILAYSISRLRQCRTRSADEIWRRCT